MSQRSATGGPAPIYTGFSVTGAPIPLPLPELEVLAADVAAVTRRLDALAVRSAAVWTTLADIDLVLDNKIAEIELLLKELNGSPPQSP